MYPETAPNGAWEGMETFLGFPLHFPTCHRVFEVVATSPAQSKGCQVLSSLCCLLLAHPRHQPVPGVPALCSVCVPPPWAQGCLPRTQGFHPSLLFCGHPSTEQKAPGSRCRHSLLIRDRSPPGARRSCPRDRSGAFWALSPLRCRAGPRVPTAAPQWRHNRLLWGQNLI